MFGGVVQVCFEIEMVEYLCFYLWCIELVGVVVFVFGVVECGVGIFEQVFGIFGIVGVECDVDVGFGVDCMVG